MKINACKIQYSPVKNTTIFFQHFPCVTNIYTISTAESTALRQVLLFYLPIVERFGFGKEDF